MDLRSIRQVLVFGLVEKDQTKLLNVVSEWTTEIGSLKGANSIHFARLFNAVLNLQWVDRTCNDRAKTAGNIWIAVVLFALTSDYCPLPPDDERHVSFSSAWIFDVVLLAVMDKTEGGETCSTCCSVCQRTQTAKEPSNWQSSS